MDSSLVKNLVLSPLFIASIISLIVTPLTIFLYRKMDWVEDPNKTRRPKDTHTYPVPRGGGIPIFFALSISALIFLPFDAQLKGILGGAAVMAIMGFFDDLYNLNPYLRLLGCFLAAGLVVGSGIGISFITNPLGGIIQLAPVVSIIFGLFWIASLSNIVNWAKGFDGQLPGIVVVAGLTIAMLAMKFSADIAQWPVAILASITAGAYLGFLPFNFYPQKIMPGYGGGVLAGFMLAVLAILSTTKIGTAMVVLGVPIIDASYSIIRRILAGQSPVWGDRGHLHHKLFDSWHWGRRRVAVFYWLVAACLGLAALNLNSQQKFYTIVMLAVLIGGLLLWFNFFQTLLKPPGRNKL